jgi:hypothetical protein
MHARPLPRTVTRAPALASRGIARRPGGAHALASAIGNRGFCALIARETKTAPPQKARKLDYTKAERQNKRYAAPATDTSIWGLGWESKLAGVQGGAELDKLWKAGSYEAFADAVAAIQGAQGQKGAAVDGVLGPGTWSKLAGLGEAMASIPVVENTDDLCYMATQRRFEGGTSHATGKGFALPKGTSKKVFDAIISTSIADIQSVEEQYRGTGAAGALVYSGKGTFVSDADIWAGQLKPGAAMQVWRSKAAYDLLVQGEVAQKKGKARAITKDDADFYGTSYVFLRYEGTNNETLVVRHHSGVETHPKSDWAVWIAANPSGP